MKESMIDGSIASGIDNIAVGTYSAQLRSTSKFQKSEDESFQIFSFTLSGFLSL
jgi:hypothetical protein